jgi:hypothetical protein
LYQFGFSGRFFSGLDSFGGMLLYLLLLRRVLLLKLLCLLSVALFHLLFLGVVGVFLGSLLVFLIKKLCIWTAWDLRE